MKFLKPFFSLFLLILSFNGIAQNTTADDLDEPVIKNAITVRPISAMWGMYGLAYERYIVKNFSIVLYGEYIEGPKIFETAITSLIRNSMDRPESNADNAKIYYRGWGVIPEVRYYFRRKEETSLVGDKDLGSIRGVFVGGYIPFRKLKMDIDITSNELHYNAYQEDKGHYQFDSYIWGLGGEIGSHWVFGNFSLEILAGLAVMSGIDSPAKFTYERPAIGSYTVDKKMGLFGTYTHLAPRLGFNLGLAF